MIVAEALVLLSIGLLAGILSTVVDVLFFGGANFLSHFTLWVLLNALVAVHVDSRLKAIWWAIPFNLGYIEGYFITTVASFESYGKSLMVPLAALALISPFLTYALWTAKREKNAYGRMLSVLIVACTAVASYFINGSLGIYDVVVCVLLALVLLVMPVKRLKISRAVRTVPEGVVAQPVGASADAQKASRPKRRISFSRRRKREREDAPEEAAAMEEDVSKRSRMALRPTRRKARKPNKAEVSKAPSRRRRRRLREQDEQARANRREEASARRSQNRVENDAGTVKLATLGTARTPRRSTRSA